MAKFYLPELQMLVKRNKENCLCLLKEQEISSIKKGIDAATLYNLQERKVSAFEQFLKGL